MTIEEWHVFLGRYANHMHLAQDEYASWLDEFEREHGEKAREEFEERMLLDA